MKKNILSVIAFILFTAAVSSPLSYAADAPSADLVAKGKDLFTSKKGLAVKFECILCHKQPGKEIKKAHIAKLGDKFPSTINKYITTKSKGKAIAENSEEMKALMAYIQQEHAK